MKKSGLIWAILGLALVFSCQWPGLHYTDKLSVSDRRYLLKTSLFRPADLADSLVFDVEKYELGPRRLLIVRAQPRPDVRCDDAPLCGTLVWRDTTGVGVGLVRRFPLKQSRDLRLIDKRPGGFVVEYFDNARDRSRFFWLRGSGEVYATGWISGLYLFKPRKIDSVRLAYTLFSMQEKMELTKKWKKID